MCHKKRFIFLLAEDFCLFSHSNEVLKLQKAFEKFHQKVTFYHITINLVIFSKDWIITSDCPVLCCGLSYCQSASLCVQPVDNFLFILLSVA